MTFQHKMYIYYQKYGTIVKYEIEKELNYW